MNPELSILKKYPACPICAGQPILQSCMYGYAFYALCSSCGWYGNVLNVEISPHIALDHWLETVDEYLEWVNESNDSCATIQIERESIISFEKHQQTLSKLRHAIKTKTNESEDIAFDVEVGE